MYKEIADKLVSALRSGEYEQASGRLRNETGHCCLGVLCDLYDKEQIEAGNGTGWTVVSPSVVYSVRYEYHGDRGVLPSAVQKWAGMYTDSGAYDYDADTGVHNDSLAGDNDRGASFAEIADFVEEQYKVL